MIGSFQIKLESSSNNNRNYNFEDILSNKIFEFKISNKNYNFEDFELSNKIFESIFAISVSLKSPAALDWEKNWAE